MSQPESSSLAGQRQMRYGRQGGGTAGVEGRRFAIRRMLDIRRLRLEYLVVPVLAIVLWEIVVATGIVDRRLVPAPHTVADTWWTWGFGPEGSRYSGTWLPAVVASATRVMLGFFIAAVAGVTVGLLIGWFRAPKVLMQPMIDALRPIPTTAWIPFSVVFFGISPAASVSLIVLGVFFPIALNASGGAQGTPRVLVNAAQMLGTSKRALLWKVVLPSALPSIVTGLRVGIAIAWILVIVSEMIAVKSGLGFSLWDAYYFNRMDIIVAAMFSVGALGYLSDQILVRLTAPVRRWAPDVR